MVSSAQSGEESSIHTGKLLVKFSYSDAEEIVELLDMQTGAW